MAPHQKEEERDAKKKYKMVALDLDGTLLGSDHTISEKSALYLRDLHNRGFLVTIATGRSASATADVIKALDFDFPSVHTHGFPVVCTNGAKGIHVFKSDSSSNHHGDEDGKGNDSDVNIESASNPMIDGRLRVEQLFHCPVPMSLTLKTLTLAKEMGCVTNYYIGHEIYAQPTCDWHYAATQRYSALTNVEFTYCNDDYKDAMSRGLPSKLLILCGDVDIDDTYQKLAMHLDGEAKVIRGSPPFFVEILHKDVCKGTGLERMCDVLGIALGDCLSFGDGDNDIEFIEKSGYGFAMKNARDNVKLIADEVTDYTNNEDGVVRALEALEQDGKLHFKSS